MSRTIKPWVGKILEVDEWEKAGKPKMWVIQDEIDNYKLYTDVAYGTLALTGRKNGIIDIGKDFVSNSGRTVVGMSEYYLQDKCRLFVQSDYLVHDREERNEK